MLLFRIIETTTDEEGELDSEPYTQEFTNLSEALSFWHLTAAMNLCWEYELEVSCYPLCETGHACWLSVRSRDMHSGVNHGASFHVSGLRSPKTQRRILEYMLGPRAW